MGLLEARELSRTYRLGNEEVPALSGASLVLAPGELAVLAGPSGSGKTTLLNLLGLLDRPTAGTLLFEGRETAQLSESERARLRRERIGFIFQSHQLIPVLSAEENVAFALWLRKMPEETCRARARRMLELVGLAGLEGRRPDALSGGQRQRVAVARALAGEPALILADEPTASLDSDTATKLLDLFEEVHRLASVTILFSSHDPRIIERAHRQVDLRDGKIISDRRVASS
ncbi:MAG: ABC transporter ATP-binding protein [Acidobacteria bacterium]|nr:ABC transporter ATP-binding protein [Acidobacteriota bacterium]MCG3190882.1 Lipoprotein-releasing system ATP-binding protein LolD [Thermoanaerobaculia bacterium]